MTWDLLLATHNEHKVLEVQAIVSHIAPGVRILRWGGPTPVEDGVTFAENALVKARAAALDTGLPALADDSGIAVDVLGGAPGIFSARWSGRHGEDGPNRDLLLAQLAEVPDDHRAAAFVCALALVDPTGADGRTVEGRWPGRIARIASGSGGFGYDPIFLPDNHDVSAAELDPAVKNAESHRARAFAALAPLLHERSDRAAPGADAVP